MCLVQAKIYMAPKDRWRQTDRQEDRNKNTNIYFKLKATRGDQTDSVGAKYVQCTKPGHKRIHT